MVPMLARRAVLSALVVVAAACGTSSGSGDEVPTSLPAENAAVAPLLPTDAYLLPAFDLARFKELIGQLTGTPVVVNMWGSWCGPCRAEAPLLARAHGEFGDRIQFLGVDIEDARESARAFMHEFGWTYPSIYDPTYPSEFRARLGYIGQPNTWFYRADGKLAFVWQGPITEEILFEQLRSLL